VVQALIAKCAIWRPLVVQQSGILQDDLLLVSATLDRQKGAKEPVKWLIPNHSYRCEYIAHFNTVMMKYDLKYIASERRIVDRLLKTCIN
jgi:hypothetical protein